MRSLKIVKTLLALVFVVKSVLCFSQTDFNIKYKRLQPIQIDTISEKIFVYEVPNAILYFKQQDINDYIVRVELTMNDSKPAYPIFKDTLATGPRRIAVKDIYYSYGERERDSILKNENIPQIEQQLNQAFYFVGADLMLNNRFMIVSKKTRRVETKGIIAKKVKGLYGTRYLDFQLPNRSSFYQVVVVLGL
jgi:hypothetical protein